MSELPGPLICEVCEYLGATPDILRLSVVSPHFVFVASEPSLWRELALRMVRAAADSYVSSWPDECATEAERASFGAEVRRRAEATAMAPFELDPSRALVAYFRVVNSVSVQLAEIVAACKPERCVVGLDRRCYDVTSL